MPLSWVTLFDLLEWVRVEIVEGKCGHAPGSECRHRSILSEVKIVAEDVIVNRAKYSKWLGSWDIDGTWSDARSIRHYESAFNMAETLLIMSGAQVMIGCPQRRGKLVNETLAKRKARLKK